MRRHHPLCTLCARTSLYDDHLSSAIRGIFRPLKLNPAENRIHRVLCLCDPSPARVIICVQTTRKVEYNKQRSEESHL